MAIPWTKILTSVPVWSVMITNFFFFAFVRPITLILPLFVKETLDFTISEVGSMLLFVNTLSCSSSYCNHCWLWQNGIYSALPSIGNVIVRFSIGPIFDHFRSKNKLSLTNLRKILHAIGKPSTNSTFQY